MEVGELQVWEACNRSKDNVTEGVTEGVCGNNTKLANPVIGGHEIIVVERKGPTKKATKIVKGNPYPIGSMM